MLTALQGLLSTWVKFLMDSSTPRDIEIVWSNIKKKEKKTKDSRLWTSETTKNIYLDWCEHDFWRTKRQ